ncbi:unnamed protein product [Boreogadus saida]
MEHAYTFGMMVCNQTIRYTEQAKHSEKVHRNQLEYLRREVERLGQDLRTSQASLSSMQTDLDATQNELDNLDSTTASQETTDIMDENGNGVVFNSLKKKEVLEAEHEGEGYVVWVGEHETQRSFGHAQMALFEEEYGCLRRPMDISNCLHKDSPYLIHRHDGQQHSKLSRLLLGTWVDAGMKGSINFNMVRSSVSSKAKQHLTQEERTRVASSMCHDVATADRFYCPVPNVTELFQVRGLRMKALLEDADTREEEDSSSVEEGEPSYDDSYDTETPPTPRSPTAQRESTSEEDLNTGTPPTPRSPTAQRESTSEEDLNTGTPPTPRSPTAQRESTSEDDLNTGNPPTPRSPTAQRGSTSEDDLNTQN